MILGVDYDDYRARDRIPALDGLRALAVTAVVTWHLPGAPLGRLNGYRGVWVFFVISGYLITTLSLREEDKRGQVSIKGFFARRTHRILPLYYLALAATCVWVFALGHKPDFEGTLPAYLVYVQEFPIFRHNFALPLGQAWSLGIEELFYVVWPIFGFMLFTRSRWRPSATVALTVACLVLMVADHGLAQFWGSLADILFGCIIALALHNRAFYARVAFLGRVGIAWAAVGVLAVAEVLSVTDSQPVERLYSVVALVAITAVVLCPTGPSTVLSWRPLVYIGTLSYGIYLFHFMSLAVADKIVPDGGRAMQLLVFPVTMAITIPVCAALHKWFEKPLIARGRRMAAKWKTPAVVPAAVPAI